MIKPASSLTLLGFDYGTQKIGLAVGQTITGTASPLSVLKAKDGIPNWAEIEALIKEWKPAALVIGMPLNMDGSESEMSIRARKFSNRLNGRFNLPCHTVDERLSSREARDISRANAERAGKRFNNKEQIDALAAQLILETWLSENT